MFFCPALFCIQKAERTRLRMSHTEARTAFPIHTPGSPLPCPHLQAPLVLCLQFTSISAGPCVRAAGCASRRTQTSSAAGARAKGIAPSGSTAQSMRASGWSCRAPTASARTPASQRWAVPRWALSCPPAGPWKARLAWWPAPHGDDQVPNWLQAASFSCKSAATQGLAQGPFPHQRRSRGERAQLRCPVASPCARKDVQSLTPLTGLQESWWWACEASSAAAR